MKYLITYYPGFKKNAWKEVRVIDQQVIIREIEENISIVHTSCCELAKIFKEKAPIFIRHIMPIHITGHLIGQRKDEDLIELLNAVKTVVNIEENILFSVQCRKILGSKCYGSKDIETYIGSYYESLGAVPSFSDIEIVNKDIYVISIFIKNDTFYIGYSKSEDNLSCHSNEYRISSRSGKKIISRAENKLIEAINKYKLAISANGISYALDMGAAPGGWSKVLADKGYNVIAVDPGELHESISKCSLIKHYKCRIEDFCTDIVFDIIVNDMNIDPQQTAQIMVQSSSMLKEKGLAIITLKMPFYDVDRSLDESIRILNEQFEILTIRNLTHNRREVTVLLKKR